MWFAVIRGRRGGMIQWRNSLYVIFSHNPLCISARSLWIARISSVLVAIPSALFAYSRASEYAQLMAYMWEIFQYSIKVKFRIFSYAAACASWGGLFTYKDDFFICSSATNIDLRASEELLSLKLSTQIKE